MSHEIPVFAGAVECSAVLGRPLSYDEALSLIPEGSWLSTSRNWWYQGLVRELCDAYASFDELRYLTEVFAVVPAAELATRIQAIKRLITTIKENTEPFVAVTPWRRESVEEVRRCIEQAEVLRDLDDDCRYAFANFFSFLVSQVAALEEAQSAGKCLLYVQAQP